ILFARIYYVIFEFDAYRGQPWWKLSADGEGVLVFKGVLFGEDLTGIVFGKLKRYPFCKMANIAELGIFLEKGVAVGGNLRSKMHTWGQLAKRHMKISINICRILLWTKCALMV